MVMTVPAAAALAQVEPVETPSTPPPDSITLPSVFSDHDIAVSPFVTFENHGYFRFRFDTLYNFDLGMAARDTDDPCTPPTAQASGATGALGNVSDTATGANIRFRWEPELRIGEFLTVGTTVDFLDNLVLGQDPYTGGAGFPMAWATTSQSWTSDRISGFNDALRIKAAWAHLYLFGVLHFVVFHL